MNSDRISVRVVRTALVTIILLYLVFLAGSVVRATGSGMGCPDWPKCFGQYIPPTDISQLPPNYKEVFKVEGKTIADFSAVHTWTEYINRMVGVLSGLSMLLLTVFSVSLWKKDRRILLLLIFALLLLGFVGWMGKVVVATNLKPLMITVHMGSALATIAVTVFVLFRTRNLAGLGRQQVIPTGVSLLLIGAFLLTLLQIVFGAQVREHIDLINEATANTKRDTWVSLLGTEFNVHVIAAWAVLLLNGLLFFRLRKIQLDPLYRRLAFFMLLVVVVEYAAGVVLYRAGMPAFVQPVHLLLATILFGLQFALVINLPMKRALK
jgi:cytochrome c oxidase assembly protein subunit 15